MQSDSPRGSSQRGESFVEALSAYSRFHRAQHWSGTFGEFLRTEPSARDAVPLTSPALPRCAPAGVAPSTAASGLPAGKVRTSTGVFTPLITRKLVAVDEK